MPALTLGQNHIHLWYADLNRMPYADNVFFRALSKDEISTAKRFLFYENKMKFVLARWILKSIIARYYLEIEPDKVCFNYGPMGKPFIPIKHNSKMLMFNKSESNGIALFAFAQSCEIGIDIEYMRSIDNLDQLIAITFTESERQKFMLLKGKEKHKKFYQCWTRKEALAKALGQGLSYPFDQIDVSSSLNEAIKSVHIINQSGETENWYISEIANPTKFSAAIAYRVRNPNLSLFKVKSGFFNQFKS